MTGTRFDAIVVGSGGVGSAALAHLARRGVNVLGLDQFPSAHDRGSSHGETRMIRQAYLEHPDYVPLLRRAYTLWDELEELTGKRLFERAGLLEVGPADGFVVPGVIASAQQHKLAVEELSHDDVRKRFPGFTLDETMAAVFESDAGYLLVEECVRAHLAVASRYGATLQTGETVEDWSAGRDGVTVKTNRQTYYADRLVVTAGAWASRFLDAIGCSLKVVRKHLHWFDCQNPVYRRDRDCPAFLFEVDKTVYYGFPQIDELGVKIAEHSEQGDPVDDPLNLDRTLDETERQRVATQLKRYLPGVSSVPTRHVVCMYTMSPDHHFIVDHHPQFPAVVFAAGLSGHGFKFASTLGEALAEMAMGEPASQPVEFLGLKRFHAV